MNRIAIAACVLLCVHLAARAADTPLADPAPSARSPRRIVLALADGDPAKMNAVFNSIDNIRDFYRKDRVAIELVAYGAGVVALLRDGSPVRARVDAATAEGVHIVACRVSLAEHGNGVADLIDRVGSVANGLPEIVELQIAGWVYLRP